MPREPYRCHLDWGRDGARRAATRRDIVVIVDTLRFSTAAVAAVQRGVLIYPCAPPDNPETLARSVGAEVAAYRRDMLTTHPYSLSPHSYDEAPPAARIVLPSPNGATCIRYGQDAPALLIGALVNAEAVGAAAAMLLTRTGAGVAVIACGERQTEPTEDGELRFAVEDYLGAGAILSYLHFDKTPEARVCAAAFVASRDQLGELLRESVSGRELRDKGWGVDVERAAQLNLYTAVPIMRHGRLESFHP